MPDKETHRKLEELGFELARAGSHLIYRHGNGAQLAAPSTASDWRANANIIAQARALAGLSNRGKESVEGERRNRKPSLAPAAIDPRGAGPVIPIYRPPPPPSEPVRIERLPDGVYERRNVPVVLANLSGRAPKPKPMPKVPIAHVRAVDALPKGMRDRVLKLAGGDYSRIRILADNRVEVLSA